jgi:hypothetical protein
MVPKDVESAFPQVDDLLDGLNILKVYPPSGFDSGISSVKDWERKMKIPLIPSEDLDNIRYWNPRTAMYYIDTYNDENLERWQYYVPTDLFTPNDDFIKRFASPEFKKAEEFPLFLPEWKHNQVNSD